MHNHTLGWTSDNGCNLFALGWLALIVVTFTPGGGLDEGLYAKDSNEESEFIQLLTAFITFIENEE